MIPNFDSIYTLITVFASAIASFLFNITLDWEDYEAKERNTQFKNDFENFSSNMVKKSILHRAKEVL